MGILDTLKDVGELIQKSDNLPLLRELITLQQEVLALVKDKADLSDRVDELERASKLRGDLTFKHSVYWMKDTDDGPFCSTCWDTKALLVRLHRDGRFPQTVFCGGCARSADLPKAVIDRTIALEEADERPPGDPCPRCRKPLFRLISSARDRTLGAVGISRREYRCDACQFEESKLSQ